MLTPAQLTTLKAAIMADQTLAGFYAAGNGNPIAAYFNEPASPAIIVWLTSLSRHEILTGTSSIGTTFAWAAGAYISRTQGERDAFREMFNDSGTVDPSLPSIKAGFADIFSGAGGAGNRAHIEAMSKRPATRYEAMFATGAGTDASPAFLAKDADGNYIAGELSPSAALEV